MQPTNKINCLAVDDEPPALAVIQKHIEAVSSLKLIGVCNNAVEALEILNVQPVDLLFLDIQMPQLFGTDFIRSLKRPPNVIFTTAFRKFAVEGFELNAVDYLLKPISFSRFLKAVNKVLDTNLLPVQSGLLPVQSGQQSAVLGRGEQERRGEQENYINFRAERRIVRVAFDDILYIESLKDYIRVFTKDRSVISKQSISSLEEALPKRSFIRIHRSYIVALGKVDSYTLDLVAIGKIQLPVSRMYRLEVAKVFKTNH